MKRCLWCHQGIDEGLSCWQLFTRDDELCGKCRKKMNLINDEFVMDDCRGLALYLYDEEVMKMIIQYKECMDECLFSIFLKEKLSWLRFKYRGYTIVPIPSSKQKVEKRGFHHVLKLIEPLQLDVLDCLVKDSDVDQKLLHKDQREKNAKIRLVDGFILPKKILLVDDVITTGSTMRAAISCLKGSNRKIEVLVVASHPLNVKKRGLHKR